MIRPFGERAVLVEVADAEAARRLDAALRADPPPGVTGILPGRASVLVQLDPSAEVAVAEDRIRARLGSRDGEAPSGHQRTIPVVYGGEHGPDLVPVAEATGRSPAELVELHASLELRVLFLGFAPGFPYLGDLPDDLHVPRLATPRTRTPAGSIGIAGPMTGIYPAELPGGWQVIGRTPVSLFDPRRDPPAYLAPGDVVRFVPIGIERWGDHAGAPDDW